MSDGVTQWRGFEFYNIFIWRAWLPWRRLFCQFCKCVAAPELLLAKATP